MNFYLRRKYMNDKLLNTTKSYLITGAAGFNGSYLSSIKGKSKERLV